MNERLENSAPSTSRSWMPLGGRPPLRRYSPKDGPLIIAADDLQWLDAASAQPMEFALRRLEDEPIGMLATARTEERPARSTDFVRTIGEGRAERIRLEPLSLGATHELLVSRLNLRQSRS